MMERSAVGFRHWLQSAKLPRWIGSIAYLLSAGVFILLMSLPESAPEVAVGIVLGVGLLALIGWKVGLYAQICGSLRLVPCLLALFSAHLSCGPLASPSGRRPGQGARCCPSSPPPFTSCASIWARRSSCSFRSHGLYKKFWTRRRGSSCSPFEKKFLFWGTVILAVAGGILYALTRGFWSSEDVVYSLDTYTALKRVFSDIYYADVRHPTSPCCPSR